MLKLEEAKAEQAQQQQDELSSKANSEDSESKNTSNINLKSKIDLEGNKLKINQAYLNLKYIFQTILDQKDEIIETLDKSAKIAKFNQLLENVHIKSTSNIDPISADLTLLSLKLYQCEIYCLDSYVQRYDAGYRASMSNDQNMKYVVEVINELAGEIQSCHC